MEHTCFDAILSAPFIEPTAPRWIARRGRNLTVAAFGLFIRFINKEHRLQKRQFAETKARDIQFMVTRKRPNITQ